MIPDLRVYRKVIAIVLIAIVVLCIWVLSGKKFTSDITDMLPDGSAPSMMLKYLNEENISGRITIELQLRDDCSNLELLPKAVKQLESLLRHQEIISTFSGFEMPEPGTLAEAYTALVPLANQDDMAEIEMLIQSEEIYKSMRSNYIRLAAPGGIELYRFIEKDPLGFNRLILKKLELFSHIISYKTAPGSTMLIGPDRRRAMIIIETLIPVSDSKRAASFIAFIDKVIKELPQEVTAKVLCGHKHTLGNEKIITSDILKVSIASLAIFTLLFYFIYNRSPAAFLIIMIPFASILIAVTIMSLVMNNVSAFVVGLGGVMAGISVDYGIHVYVQCCKSSSNRAQSILKIVRPLGGGAATTMAIFIAFLFAGVNTYTQLGTFAIICIALSLFMALYILPNLLPDKLKESIIHLRTPVFTKRKALIIVFFWVIIFAASSIISFTSSFFDNSITSLDGAGEEVLNAERDFNAYWSKQEMPAILAIKGDNREQVLQAGEALAAAAKKHKIAGFISPVTLTPSDKTLQHNIKVWNEFWNAEKINKTLALISEAGVKNSFRPDAFLSFDEWLRKSPINAGTNCNLIKGIQEKLLKNNKGKWTLTSFMPDTKDNFTTIEKIQKQIPGLRVISPYMLRYSIGTEVLNCLVTIGAVSLGVMFILSVLATSSFLLGVIALLPVVTALTVICGFSAALSMPLTIPSCVAIIIIIGLSIDYGIFMVFYCFKSLHDDAMTPITLCALTTVAGAASLLFASHPVMFKLGLTLFSGIVVSYVSAVILIPVLAVFIKVKNKRWIYLLGFISVLISCGGCSLYNTLPEPGPLLSFPAPQTYNPPDKQWSTVSYLTFFVFGQQDSMLCAAEFDASQKSGSIVCMQPGGIKILEASFLGDKITNKFVIPELEKQGLKVDDVIRDIRRISFNNKAKGEEGVVYEFDKDTGMLMTKKFIKNGCCIWEISYRQYKLIDGYSVPLEMRLNSNIPSYSLLIKIKEFSEIQPKFTQ